MPARKKVDPLKAKQQKQKIFVIAGGVLLLLVFAYEAKTLGLIGGKKPPAEAAPVTAPAGTPTAPNSLTPPALPGGGTATPAAATTSGDLADTDPPIATSEGQLVSFDVFETKNPFSPQVHADSSGGGASEPAPASGAVPADAGGSTPADSSHADVPAPGATVTPSTAPAGGTTPASGTTTTTTPTAPRVTVTISVNGRSERVGKDGTFPSGAPVFRLVSWTSGTAEIGIVGGSYQSGGQTLTLEKGKPVTLMNTSDDKKYKLVLLATP
jgi:hypothetical protein